MSENGSTREATGFIVEPILVLGLVVGLLLAHTVGAAQELSLRDRLVLGGYLAATYGMATAVVCGLPALVLRRRGRTRSRVDPRFAAGIALVPCAIFVVASALDVQRVTHTTARGNAAWLGAESSTGAPRALILTVVGGPSWSETEREIDTSAWPLLAARARVGASGALEVPPGTVPNVVWATVMTGRAPKRPAVAGRRRYRMAGIREVLSDDLPRGVGLVTLVKLGVLAGVVDVLPASDAVRAPTLADAVRANGGRVVLLDEQAASDAMDDAKQALSTADPALVIVRAPSYDTTLDATLADLDAASDRDPAHLVVSTGAVDGIGWMLVYRPGIGGRPLRDVRWTDVFPTALSLLALPVPDTVPGRPVGVEPR